MGRSACRRASAISTSTGTISGTMAAGDAALGPYFVTVSVGNGSASASQSFTWNVIDPISFVTPADQTNNEGDSVSLAISAADASAGTLTYGAVGLPGGLSISSSTGTISGTVSIGAAADGPYSVTVMAEDGTYSNETSFTWNVNNPITLTTPDDQSNTFGDTASLSVVASGSGTLAYSATDLPSGLSINSSTGVISGTISAGGTFEPIVTVGNGTYSTSAGFEWDVSSTITITDSGDQAFNAGDAVSVPISASDTVAGTLTYSASGLPSGASISSSTGLITGTLSASAGTYSSTITVSDGTETEVDVFNWTIYAASDVSVTNPGNKTNTDGDSVSWSVSASDSNMSGTLSYSAAELPPGLSIDTSTGAISGTVAANASLFGPYLTTLTATDGTYTDSQTFTWTVNSPISLTNPGTQTTSEGSSGVAVHPRQLWRRQSDLFRRRSAARSDHQQQQRRHLRHRGARCRPDGTVQRGGASGVWILCRGNVLHLEYQQPDQHHHACRPDHHRRHNHLHAVADCLWRRHEALHGRGFAARVEDQHQQRRDHRERSPWVMLRTGRMTCSWSPMTAPTPPAPSSPGT